MRLRLWQAKVGRRMRLRFGCEFLYNAEVATHAVIQGETPT